MSNQILPFIQRPAGAALTRNACGTADIIIFPGVRYEQAPASARPFVPKRRPPGTGPQGELRKG